MGGVAGLAVNARPHRGSLIGSSAAAGARTGEEFAPVTVVDVAPFVVVLLVGAGAGRFVPGSAAWFIALLPPVAHFALSVLTGRAGEDLLSYVVPVNLVLLGLALMGLLSGQALRRRTRPLSARRPGART